jgi:hypothetical protein
MKNPIPKLLESLLQLCLAVLSIIPFYLYKTFMFYIKSMMYSASKKTSFSNYLKTTIIYIILPLSIPYLVLSANTEDTKMTKVYAQDKIESEIVSDKKTVPVTSEEQMMQLLKTYSNTTGGQCGTFVAQLVKEVYNIDLEAGFPNSGNMGSYLAYKEFGIEGRGFVVDQWEKVEDITQAKPGDIMFQSPTDLKKYYDRGFGADISLEDVQWGHIAMVVSKPNNNVVKIIQSNFRQPNLITDGNPLVSEITGLLRKK